MKRKPGKERSGHTKEGAMNESTMIGFGLGVLAALAMQESDTTPAGVAFGLTSLAAIVAAVFFTFPLLSGWYV